MPFNVNTDFSTIFAAYLVPIFWKLLGAIVLWIIGGYAINLVKGMVRKALALRQFDSTLAQYIETTAGVLLRILLIIAVLSVFGVATTSFAAILAAAGVAIGMAWSGLLANFAAGVFLIILRPFKVGDFVSAAGVTGEVKEIGLFATTIDTGDNLRTFVGNNKIFSDTIQNYTTNPYRRVDLKAQLAHGVDPYDAIGRLKTRVQAIPNVIGNPAPSIEILEFNEFGCLLAVRPFCHNNHYWDVYFATNQAIYDVCRDAGYPAPERRNLVRNA